MTNRNRAWRRRQRNRILNRVNTTREWANDKFEMTRAVLTQATDRTMKLHVKARRKLAGQAQILREAWRTNQEFNDAHFREVTTPTVPAA